jgi:hypothetical protein
MKHNRTNPAYAYLAYRKAIIGHTITYLLSNVVGSEGLDATVRIVSDDVFREDEDVPTEEVQSYVDELQEEEARLSLEMSQFEFVRAKKLGVPESGTTREVRHVRKKGKSAGGHGS